MDVARPGPGECHRLATLALYDILDTNPEPAFDDLAELAADVFQTPISLISLVDEHRQWFKSNVGLDARQTPVEQSFCSHTILKNEPMVIIDAHADPRFADNPLVTDTPYIRFYAGAPLIVADGSRLGSLCVIDRMPRTPGAQRIRFLQVLRDAVVAQLELRRLRADSSDTRQTITMCAWCSRIKTGDAGSESKSWVEPQEYLEGSAPVTHGICPTCRLEMLTDE